MVRVCFLLVLPMNEQTRDSLRVRFAQYFRPTEWKRRPLKYRFAHTMRVVQLGDDRFSFTILGCQPQPGTLVRLLIIGVPTHWAL